jgi:NADH-quinone oxidoreductase subunit H
VLLYSQTLSTRGIANAQSWTTWDSFVTEWYWAPAIVAFVIFLIAAIAELGRAPFDMAEGESELVAGYNTEYSGMKFGMFFIGEYLGITLVSAMVVTLFFGGWLGPSFLPPVVWFILKTFVFIIFFILLRASLPRPRYDQLMEYGWKILLPLSLINLLVTGALILMLK